MTTLLNLHFPVLKYRKIILKKKTKCNQVCRSFDSPFLRKFTRIKNRIIIEYITMKCFRPFDRLNFFDKERGEKRGKIKLPIRVMMRSTQENKGVREREREQSALRFGLDYSFSALCSGARAIRSLCSSARIIFLISVPGSGMLQIFRLFSPADEAAPLQRTDSFEVHSNLPLETLSHSSVGIGLACVSFGSR